jgi:hypothetical protein
MYFQPLASTLRMLNISHKQTKAYHPESNSAVERLHSCLKDALCARAATATWSEKLPFVLLGLRAQPREDTSLSPAEAVFGAQIVLLNECSQNDEFSVDDIIKFFFKTLHVSAPSLPRHNSSTAPTCPVSCQPSCSLPPSSGSAGAVWFRPFSRSTMAPMQSFTAAPAPSPSESGRGTRWLPSASVRLARPRTPGPAAPSHPPQMLHPSCQQAPPKKLDLGPLLLPAEARARGSPVESCLRPCRRSNQSGVL